MPSVISATTTNGVAISPDNSGSLQLATNNGTTAVTIDTSQNVGIGTSSPSFKLDIVGSAARISNAGTANFATRNSTAGVNWEFGVDGSGNGFIYSGQSSALAFSTNASERMRITSGGSLLVGTTSENFATGNGAYFTSGGRGLFTASSNSVLAVCRNVNTGNLVDWYQGGNYIGSVSTNGSTITYGGTSDYRLKDDIKPLTNALDKVVLLKPCEFTWKNTGIKDNGFLAHELAEVCPNAVVGEKDAVNEDGSIKPQQIDTSFLVATLTAAIQELKAELDATKAEVQALKEGKQ